MESSIATSLFKEMANAIHTLYRAAPPIPFKHGNEFYSALRAADKAKVFLEGDLEALIEMEREDTRYWRHRYMAAARHEPSRVASPTFSLGSAASDDHIGISIAPPETRNIIIGTPLRSTPLSLPVPATPLSADEEDSVSVSVPVLPVAGAAAPLRSSPLNPEEDDEFSPIELAPSVASSVSMPPPQRPRVSLFGITATPNMGPILPSPLRSVDPLYDAI